MLQKQNPVDKFAKIHNLLRETNELDYKTMMTSLTKYLDGSSLKCTFAINFERGGKYTIKITNNQAKIVEEGSKLKVDFEVFIEEQTALRVALGKISPIFALGREKMRISGNTSLAIQVYEKLAADKGLIDPCRRR